MRRYLTLAIAAAIPALGVAGCKDFLTGEGLTTNPNRPSSATADQLWVGVQVNTFANWETYPFTLMPLWVGQLAGVDRQWKNYGQYRSAPTDQGVDFSWQQIYGGGGLSALRQIEAQATAANNLVFRG